MKHPVPYVFFISPASKHVWPKRAACWSPNDPRSQDCSGNTRDFHAVQTADARAVDFAAGHDSRKDGAIHADDGEQIIIPVVRSDVHHHRSTRVGDVGDVQSALEDITRENVEVRGSRQ